MAANHDLPKSNEPHGIPTIPDYAAKIIAECDANADLYHDGELQFPWSGQHFKIQYFPRDADRASAVVNMKTGVLGGKYSSSHIEPAVIEQNAGLDSLYIDGRYVARGEDDQPVTDVTDAAVVWLTVKSLHHRARWIKESS